MNRSEKVISRLERLSREEPSCTKLMLPLTSVTIQRVTPGSVALEIITIILALIAFIPVLWMAVVSLKTDEASAVIGQYTTDNARVRLTGSSALMESRAISRRALDTVVNARLKELFTVIRETLEEADLIHRLHAGVVIAGGGAGMRALESLAELELGLGVRRGRPLQVDGLEDVSDPWAFATISGALLYSQRASGTDKSFLGDIIGRFFK